jgi:hypothetical protein
VGTDLIWPSLATSARSFSIFSSTDTTVAEAAIAGVPEASKGKDGRRCQTSGGSASEGAVCRVCEGAEARVFFIGPANSVRHRDGMFGVGAADAPARGER